MFCSIIIPTIGRSTLARAVNSVLAQQVEQASFELIVVNDSGRPLPVEAWQQSGRVRILHNNRRERSFARNAGAAVARSDYLYFLDDDDWLLPGALAEFWQLAQQSPAAAWLHGGIQVVDEHGRCLAESNSAVAGACLAQIMGGAWVPIQSSLIRATDFFAVGGYDPLIRVTQDQDLCRRIAARGLLANTPTAVACLFRGAGWNTSTEYSRAAEDTRHSRDNVLNWPGAFKRLITSANSSYWHGRIVHVYLSRALWHWRRGHFFATVSRALYGLLALLLSVRHLLLADFWRALRAHHVPGSLHFIQLAWEEQLNCSDQKLGVAQRHTEKGRKTISS